MMPSTTDNHAMEYIAKAIHAGLSQKHGPDAPMLLAVVALSENPSRAEHWDSDMADYVGCTVRKMIETRSSLVRSGWLAFNERVNAPGVYRLLTPEESRVV